MPNVSLNAFLRIISKNTPQKTQDYSRYLSKGGYDFYWRLKAAAEARIIGGQSLDQCSAIVSKAKGVERKHNLSAVKTLDKWLVKWNADGFFETPSAVCSSPEGYLNVKLEPEFGYVHNGRRRVVSMWASQSVTMPSSVAGCGLYLIKEHICVEEYADCQPAILDPRRGELLVADELPKSAPLMVASELAWADGFFKAVAKAA